MFDEQTLDDIFNEFISEPIKESYDKEYYEIENRFCEMFGHFVPREMLPPGVTTEQIKEAMKKCIENQKDELFDVLGVESTDV